MSSAQFLLTVVCSITFVGAIVVFAAQRKWETLTWVLIAAVWFGNTVLGWASS